MAKKKASFDVNSTLDSIIGSGGAVRPTPTLVEETGLEPAPAPAPAEVVTPEIPDNKAIKVHKSYYLTEDIVKAVALKSALSGMDKSEIVRAALQVYLQTELTFLQNDPQVIK